MLNKMVEKMVMELNPIVEQYIDNFKNGFIRVEINNHYEYVLHGDMYETFYSILSNYNVNNFTWEIISSTLRDSNVIFVKIMDENVSCETIKIKLSAKMKKMLDKFNDKLHIQKYMYDKGITNKDDYFNKINVICHNFINMLENMYRFQLLTNKDMRYGKTYNIYHVIYDIRDWYKNNGDRMFEII